MSYRTLLAASALLASTGLASAQDMFGLISRMDEGTFIEINVPNVTQDGYLAAYPVAGQSEELLGYELVQAGANPDTRIRLPAQVTSDVIVYLFQGEPFQPIDAAVDSVRVEIDERGSN